MMGEKVSMLTKSGKQIFSTLLLSLLITTVSAEDAPVYDVDNYPPQFDGQTDMGGTAGTAAEASPPVAPQASPDPSVSQASPPQPMDQRINRLEQQMTNMQHSNSAAKLSSLQNEVQALRGQVEELTHQLQQAQTQQRAMYSDLDKRLSAKSAIAPTASQAATTEDEDATVKTLKKSATTKPKTKAALAAATPSIPAADEPPLDDPAVSPKPVDTATTATSAAKTAQSASADQEELQMYQKAYDLIKDSKFDQAISVLQSMLKKYPSGQSAANAHYWLGELYGLQKKQDQAAVEFGAVVKEYPNSPKVSDAQVKLGMIYAAQFKWAEAKSTFKKVMSHYPGTTSARLAGEQLKEIKSGGH